MDNKLLDQGDHRHEGRISSQDRTNTEVDVVMATRLSW